jgi:outer membrane protein
MKYRSISCYVVATLLAQPLHAQTPWTLRQCADYAIEHNISIKQKDNQRKQRDLQLSTARNSRLPDLSASASESFSFGRGLTLDNTYTNRSTNSTSFSLGTTVPLFTGFRIPNQIKLNQLNLEAATKDLEKAKDDISMQVAKAYVQILYDTEIAEVAHRQIAIDSAQVVRLEAFVQNGKSSQAALSQQQSTLAQARLTATQADNNLQLSILALSQLLEFPSPEGFSIVRPAFSTTPATSLAGVSPDAIYQEALAMKPEVQAEQLRLTASERSIKIAKAALYPTLNFSAGLQSNYYKTNGMQADPFATQMKNNFSQYIGLHLNVPIFTRFQARNSIRSARIDYDNQQLQLENVKKTLYKEIQQVYYNAVAADSKYHSSEAAAQSSQDAFTLVQAKYENGKATITEFNEAKNNYLKAESNLVQARYELLYQHALLNFYLGKELSF